MKIVSHAHLFSSPLHNRVEDSCKLLPVGPRSGRHFEHIIGTEANLTLSELNNAADIAHKRIYDRILERCVPIRINNRNIRQDNATANLKKTKKILLDNHTSNQS